MKKGFLAIVVVVTIGGLYLAGRDYKHVSAKPINEDSNITAISGNATKVEKISETEGQLTNINITNQKELSSLRAQCLNDFKSVSNQANKILKTNEDSVSGMYDGAGSAATLWSNELNNLYNKILPCLSPAEKNALVEQENAWVQYKKDTINSLTKEEGQISPLLKANVNLYLIQERCYYLFFYYLNNNQSINMSDFITTTVTDNADQKALASWVEKLNQNSQNGSKLISQANNNDNLVLAYSKDYTMWNSQLTSLYSDMLSKLANYQSIPQYDVQAIEPLQEQWQNYRKSCMEIAKTQYNNETNKEMGADKVGIALTQARIFYLLNNYTTFLGLNK